MKNWIISEERWELSCDAAIGTLSPDNIIEVSDEKYEELQNEGNNGKRIVVRSGSLVIEDVPSYSQETMDQLESNGESKKALDQSDWKVIRELERLYLQGTDLNVEREAYRSAIAEVETPELK